MKHKKTIKKASVIILLAISLVFVLPFSAFCAEATDISEDTRQEHSVAPNEPLENTDTENPYSVIFNTFLENSPQILSALAFIGSIIIMLCYKKGLIPLIKEALSALSSGVKSIGEKTENIGSDSKRISNELTQKLQSTEEIVTKLEKIAIQLYESKEEKEKVLAKSESLKAVLLTEIEMLYEIFMSATLPQYLKDRVGEKISAMKAELSEGEVNLDIED